MNMKEQAQNMADELAGKAKDAVGDVTDDNSRQAEGRIDQATAKVKQAAGKATDKAEEAVDEVAAGHGIINRLHRFGVKSEYAYIAGFASIGLSLTSWLVSRAKAGDQKPQSDRWGIFVGHWAPTFMALGVALKLEEDR